LLAFEAVKASMQDTGSSASTTSPTLPPSLPLLEAALFKALMQLLSYPVSARNAILAAFGYKVDTGVQETE
jgi:hypothetical protein